MSDKNGNSDSSGNRESPRANRKAQVADTPDFDPRGGVDSGEDGGSNSEEGGDE